MRTGRDAITWARAQVDNPTQDWRRLCLSFVRQAFGLPVGYPDAGTAWDRAKRRHPIAAGKELTIPAGVPVFWETPGDADHVAFSVGGGLCLSNDVRRAGRIDLVKIASIGPAWGAELLGWTEDLNGQPVWTKPAPGPTNVTKARDHLATARHHLARAAFLLDSVPETRKNVHDVEDKLRVLVEKIENKRERLPAR